MSMLVALFSGDDVRCLIELDFGAGLAAVRQLDIHVSCLPGRASSISGIVEGSRDSDATLTTCSGSQIAHQSRLCQYQFPVLLNVLLASTLPHPLQ